jgi:hypothetical protein
MNGRARIDVGAVLAGVVLATVGLFAMVGGSAWFAATLHWIWPLALIGLGVAFLVGRPPQPTSPVARAPRQPESAGEHRPGDHVGPERGEDR